MKQRLCAILASSLLLSLPALGQELPENQDIPETPITQQTLSATTGECGDFLRWSFDSNTGTMTISGTGKMRDYPNYAPPWVAYREQIQTLVVESGVTTLGWSSFQWCSALTQVFLPDTLSAWNMALFPIAAPWNQCICPLPYRS